MENLQCIGFIPARSGSKRIPNKNIKILGGHPMIAYTIVAAKASGVFNKIIVSTDSEEIKEIAIRYGAEVPFLRPEKFSGGLSPDIEWVLHALHEMNSRQIKADYFAILRPTSPFRLPETIQRAWQQILNNPEADSLRAVEKCSQHPAKMWKVEGDYIYPLMENPDKNAIPWHSMPYQSLPEIYVQNASLEIARTSIPLTKGTIAGEKIIPFFTEKYEGFDINLLEDWIVAEYLLANDLVKLPKIV